MLLAVLLQRCFQAALPDEAPGSNHVGDDVDLQGFLVHHFPRKR